MDIERMEASEDPTSPVRKKRCLERRRRELMHARFEELEALLSAVNSRGNGQDVKGRRADKEKILVDACDCIRKRENSIADLDRKVATAKKEAVNLKNEKLELRGDKRYLRNEIEQLRNENGQLRADTVRLWQEMRKEREVKPSDTFGFGGAGLKDALDPGMKKGNEFGMPQSPHSVTNHYDLSDPSMNKFGKQMSGEEHVPSFMADVHAIDTASGMTKITNTV